MDNKKYLFEAELVNYVKIDVVLPDGQKEKATLNFENTIKQEKEMILERNKLRYADIYVMVLMGAHNSRTILDDNHLVSHYANLLATGSEPYLEIAKNSSELERPPRPVNPAQFGITLNQTLEHARNIKNIENIFAKLISTHSVSLLKNLYVMILCGQDSSRKILSDDATVRFYEDQLSENNAQIEINLQSSANEQQASAADSQKYNFKLK